MARIFWFGNKVFFRWTRFSVMRREFTHVMRTWKI